MTQASTCAGKDGDGGRLCGPAFRAALDRAIDAGTPAVLLATAIDRFDALNAIYGFEAGERIVEAVMPRIGGNVAPGTAIGTLGHDTLGILVTDISGTDIGTLAEALHDAVRREALVAGEASLSATISTGIVALPDGAGTVSEALSRAREALYLARQRGAGHFVAYRPSPARKAAQRANAALSANLVAALRERRLNLAFQPVVDIETRQPLFHEALVRIDRPGDAAADDVAALAERLGLVRLVDRLVLELALDRLEATDARLSVNVSAHTLGDAEWLRHLAGRLAAKPGLAKRLIIELTETAMIGSLDEAAAFIRRLHDAGCRVAIDDFGAGFTSFRNLRVLDVDIVKIDGAYIEALAANPDDRVFVKVLAELAGSLGITVIAEWVQDEETVAVLSDLGVAAIQGRLTGEASPELPRD